MTNFQKINDDLTKSIKSEIKRYARKLIGKITKDEYTKLYPRGSNPGKIYGTAVIHKLMTPLINFRLNQLYPKLQSILSSI